MSLGTRCESQEPSYTFKKVELDCLEWGVILETFRDRTLFQSPEWLRFVARTQQAKPVFGALRDADGVLGYFVGLLVNRFGVKILGSPLPGWTTSYMGMNLIPGVSRSHAMRALIRFAFEELDCSHIEVMDRHLTTADVEILGCDYRRYQGFEIDLTRSEEQLFANMTSACRRCIRRAIKCGVHIEEAHDVEFADDYYGQLEEVFQHKGLVPTYGRERVRELIRCVSAKPLLLLLRARDSQGTCIATGIFPAFNGTMYFWGGASRRAAQIYRPNEAIQWYAMRYWKARGVSRYDMSGGGEYKRKYGGAEILVPWLRKSKYPWIGLARQIAKYAHGWHQRARGAMRTGPAVPNLTRSMHESAFQEADGLSRTLSRAMS